MKLSSVLKIFGAAALLGGLTPYQVSTDDETGEKKVRALFWEATKTPVDEDSGEGGLSVQVGFFSPVKKDDEETHLFADDLTVEYDQDGEDEAEPAAEESAVEPEEGAVETEEVSGDETEEKEPENEA